MQDCAVFPDKFFRYFSFLFLLLFSILLVMNYTLYRLGVYKKGKLLYRFKRLAMFLGFLLFILLVFSLYLWLYGSCIYIVQRLLWLPLLLILVIPMMTYELLVYFGYVESRKIRRMKMLIRRHEDELERLARIEEHGLALVEIDVSRRLFRLYDAKHPLMRQVPENISLYNVLIRLARHRVSGEDAVELEKKAETLFGRILSAQPFLDEVSRDKSLVPLQRGMYRLKTFFHEKRENEAALRRIKTEIVKERKAGKPSEKQSMDADKDPKKR